MEIVNLEKGKTVLFENLPLCQTFEFEESLYMKVKNSDSTENAYRFSSDTLITLRKGHEVLPKTITRIEYKSK